MKILNELDELVSAEVISAEVAERIRNYAQERTPALDKNFHFLPSLTGRTGSMWLPPL